MATVSAVRTPAQTLMTWSAARVRGPCGSGWAGGGNEAERWGDVGGHRLVPDGVVGRPADRQRQDRAGQPRRQGRRPEAVAQVAAEREGAEAQGSDTDDKSTLGSKLEVGGMGMGEHRDIGTVRRPFPGRPGGGSAHPAPAPRRAGRAPFGPLRLRRYARVATVVRGSAIARTLPSEMGSA